MKPEISVIMPVYNIEKYLPTAIESILKQTFKNFELIVLDDKSEDNTLSIAKDFAKKDSRVKVIELEKRQKQGVGRNIGIQYAIGDYIMFLDGDDIAKDNFLEKMFFAIKKTNADIAMCKFQTLDDRNGKISDTHPFGQVNISEEMIEKGFTPLDIKQQIFTIPNIVWNKIYSKQYLIDKQISFPAIITMCEDIIFGINATLKADKLAYVDENLLYYRINRPKASSGGKDDTFFDVFTQYEILTKNFKEMNIYDSIKKEFISDAIYTMLFFLERIKPKFKKRFFNKMQEIFQKYYDEEFSTKEIFMEHVLNNGALWAIAIANAFVYFVRYGILDWAPLYLQNVKDFNFSKSGFAYFGFELAGIVGTILCGWVSDKIFKGKRAPVNAIFMALTALAIVVYWLNPKGSPMIDMIALFAIGFLIYGPVMLIGLQALDMVSKKAAGTAAGFTGFFGYFLGTATLANLGMGYITEHLGWDWSFALIIGACLITILIMIKCSIDENKQKS